MVSGGFVMVDKINFSTYYKIAEMNQSLTRFIKEALTTKIQINTSLLSKLSSYIGIGNKIDILA